MSNQNNIKEWNNTFSKSGLAYACQENDVRRSMFIDPLPHDDTLKKIPLFQGRNCSGVRGCYTKGKILCFKNEAFLPTIECSSVNKGLYANFVGKFTVDTPLKYDI